MADLISLSRATSLVPNFPTADNSIMQSIVTACSDLIKRYCNREFIFTTYDECYDGQGYANLLLNDYPIQQVDRVSYMPTYVVQILFTDFTYATASWRLDSTNLYLITEKNGSSSTVTIARSGCPTLTDLAAAINQNAGWQALALAPYAGFSTSRLRAPQGAMAAERWTPYIKDWVFDLWDYDQNPQIGELVSSMGFGRGYRNWRVIYKSGFGTTGTSSDTPEPIAQACAELAVATYYARDKNMNIQGENLGGYSYTNLADHTFKALSIGARNALALYKNHRINKFKVF